MSNLGYKHSGARALSHSRIELLNTCGRKFELEGKLNIRKYENNMTFAFGHMFGTGAQAIIEGLTLEEALWRVFAEWEIDIEDLGTAAEQKAKKSFWYGIEALEYFYDMVHNGETNRQASVIEIDFTQYDIAKITIDNGEIIPANELEVVLECGEDFYYECHIDLVLQHKVTKRFAVLDMKTSSANTMHPANFNTSPQVTGYMMCVDAALNKNAEHQEAIDSTVDFDALYCVYLTKSQTFQTFKFTKTPLHRTQWIEYMVSNMDRITRLEELSDAGLHYPIDSKGCFAYFRPCYFNGNCHLPNEVLGAQPEMGQAFDLDETPPHLTVTLDSLIERQEHLLETAEVTDIIITDAGTSSGLALLQEMTI